MTGDKIIVLFLVFSISNNKSSSGALPLQTLRGYKLFFRTLNYSSLSPTKDTTNRNLGCHFCITIFYICIYIYIQFVHSSLSLMIVIAREEKSFLYCIVLQNLSKLVLLMHAPYLFLYKTLSSSSIRTLIDHFLLLLLQHSSSYLL